MPAGRSPALGGLTEVLTQETRGLEEFAGVLERQRIAVSEGDRVKLEATVEDLDRLVAAARQAARAAPAHV